MPSVPTWREPTIKIEGHKNANWALELHRPSWTDSRIPKCEAIAVTTGVKCRGLAVRGTRFCRKHKGTAHLEKIIAKGHSARTYGPDNPRFGTKINVGARTTKSNLSGHIIARKHKRAAYGRFYESEGLFLKSLSVSVRQSYDPLSKTEKLKLFLAWEQKNVDPRGWQEALKKVLNG